MCRIRLMLCTALLTLAPAVSMAGREPLPLLTICANDECNGIVDCETISDEGDAAVADPVCTPPGPYPLGDTLVSIMYPDGSQATRVVRVIDCTAPVLDCPPGEITVECGEVPAMPTVTGVDNCDATVTVLPASSIVTVDGCGTNFDIHRTWTAVDAAGNRATCVQNVHVRDTQPPTIGDATINNSGLNSNCVATLQFSAPVSDCGLSCDDVSITYSVIGGNAGALVFTPNIQQLVPGARCLAAADLLVSGVDCSVQLRVTVTATDECGHQSSRSWDVTVADEDPPVLTCPAEATLEVGDGICSTAFESLINSITAVDNCDEDVSISTDVCGLPAGQTTPLVVTASDECGNSSSCTILVTVKNNRTRVDQKGSLLVYSKIELRWRLIGGQWQLVQDTIIELSNDNNQAVSVQLYFINGDPELPPAGAERGHPGCNNADNIIHLTQNQPIWWAASTGQPQGVFPFASLDTGNPPGRPDPDGSADRVLRGYMLAWAVDNLDHEIRWNHLFGKATIIHYADSAAWEYAPWAFQARCVPEGSQPLDCILRDANGVCCDAAVIPGRLDLDGFQYDYAPGQLLGEFFATNPPQGAPPGPSGLSLRNLAGGVLHPVNVDSEIVLHPAGADLRQDNNGPVITKAKFAIWNQNEVQFSNTEYCISCWDQHLMSRILSLSGVNHFTRNFLQTDAGKYRVNGIAHEPCLATDQALLGLQAAHLVFQGGARESAGGNLVGQGNPNGGNEAATILYDPLTPGSELRRNPAHGDAGSAAKGLMEQDARRLTPSSAAGLRK